MKLLVRVWKRHNQFHLKQRVRLDPTVRLFLGTSGVNSIPGCLGCWQHC